MSWKLREDVSKRREYCVECHLQGPDNVEVIKHFKRCQWNWWREECEVKKTVKTPFSRNFAVKSNKKCQ